MTPKWISHFMAAAELAATMSKDPDHKVGTVIVDHLRRSVGVGYNGFPRGVRDLPERLENKRIKRMMIVHAEANAILNSRSSIVDCTLLTTRHPCTDCAKLIIQSGIAAVHCPPLESGSSWEEDSVMAAFMLREAGVVLHLHLAYPEIAPLTKVTLDEGVVGCECGGRGWTHVPSDAFNPSGRRPCVCGGFRG